jgi:mannosyl-3-phosphoglycerate phosphatase
MDKKVIIFTDLDGTLLDSGYSYKKAAPALNLIMKKRIPLILCSSKTKSEIVFWRKKLRNIHPFISENGGGIFIPRKYFKGGGQVSGVSGQVEGDYYLIKLGADYAGLRKVLSELRSEGFNVNGFGDMSIQQIADLTGLKNADAKRAIQRDFDEPFLFKGNDKQIPKLKRRIRAKGFNYTQGEFFHIMGDSDKGRAVEILKILYSGEFSKIVTVALGDSLNDLEMLRAVDYPVVVQKKDGSYDKSFSSRKLIRADGIGPDGWNRVVTDLLETLIF